MTKSSSWFIVAVFNFLIAACYGLLMRYAFVAEIGWIDYRNLMHGHSHVAMLGWLYMSLYLLLLHIFVKGGIQNRFYTINFILTEITILGMAISFPIQGYGLFSIVFSTLHVLLSYAFIIRFFKDIRGHMQKNNHSVILAKSALLFMFLSTVALFTMAPIMVMDMKSTNLYYMAVQFFLHFQFNGWFIFGILAIFFRLLENRNIRFQKVNFKRFYWFMVISCILSYALAVTWSNPSSLLFGINSIGVVIQLIALIFFIRIIHEVYPQLKSEISKGVDYLLTLSFISFCLKIIVQSAVVIPYIAKIAYTVRNYVIGFIHLILLGAITFAILAFASRAGYISLNKKSLSWGIVLLAFGIILSEFLLFVQGTLLWGAQGFIPFYYEILCGISALMPLGVGLILGTLLFQKKVPQLL